MSQVLVVGSGNAALCAALAAREAGAQVLVVESATRAERGGNSFFTAGLVRFPYRSLADVQTLVPDLGGLGASALDVGSYDESAFRGDLERVTDGRTDPTLAGILVREALPTMRWLQTQGARFALCLGRGRQAFEERGVLRFFGSAPVELEGGGSGHVDRLCALCEARGVAFRYGARARELTFERGRVSGLVVETAAGAERIAAHSVVLACGGFEASAEKRARHLGAHWVHAKVRGTRHNLGDGIEMALAAGARRFGQWNGAHAVAWDANAPDDAGDRARTHAFNRHSYPFGIVVNRRGERFLDEGADFRNYTYARYGAAILEQPEHVAFQIFDAKAQALLRDEYLRPGTTCLEASSPEELAKRLGIDVARFCATLRTFNAAVGPERFDPTRLDGKATRGLDPPKSNWAQTLDTPPFQAYPSACGITFTFGGLQVDADARVLREDASAIAGLFGAGEIVGGLFHGNYPGGAGLSAGAVFGRLAGRSAAR
jgi:tricarballylate dehydrogenase